MGISNQRGNVFIGSLIFLAMAVGFSVLAPNIARISDVQIKSSRARAVMATQEMKIRAVLMEPSTYVGCSAGNRGTCTFNSANISPLRFVKVPGCGGSTDPLGCGVKLANESFNPMTLTFTGTLSYTGRDTSLRDTPISFELPPEVLQAQQISCSASNPLFAGFETDGTIRCVNLPGDCPIGKYASGFDTGTLQPRCLDLPANVACAANEIVTNYTWVGGTTGLTHNCSPRSRSTVESHFGFSPVLVAATAPGVPAPSICNLAGVSVASGSSITAYATASVPFGQSCQSESRVCNNGSLTGSFANTSCTVGTALACNFNGQSVAHGSSVTAYAASSVPSGSQCQSEFRVCNNGALSGSNAFGSCTVNSGPIGFPEAVFLIGWTFTVPAGITSMDVIAIGGGGGGAGKGANNRNGVAGGDGTPTRILRNGVPILVANGGTGGIGGSEWGVGTGGSSYDPGENGRCLNGEYSPPPRGGGQNLLKYMGISYGSGGDGQAGNDDNACRGSGGGGGSGETIVANLAVTPGEVLFVEVGGGGQGGDLGSNGAQGIACLRKPGDVSRCILGSPNPRPVAVYSNSFGPPNFKITYDDMRSPLRMCREAGFYGDYVNNSRQNEFSCLPTQIGATYSWKHNGGWHTGTRRALPRWGAGIPAGQDWCGGLKYIEWVKCLPN